jgi:hypothetical protein
MKVNHNLPYFLIWFESFLRPFLFSNLKVNQIFISVGLIFIFVYPVWKKSIFSPPGLFFPNDHGENCFTPLQRRCEPRDICSCAYGIFSDFVFSKVFVGLTSSRKICHLMSFELYGFCSMIQMRYSGIFSSLRSVSWILTYMFWILIRFAF